ncbi:hypothetical protein D3C85_1179340 [compost metagenome]
MREVQEKGVVRHPRRDPQQRREQHVADPAEKAIVRQAHDRHLLGLRIEAAELVRGNDGEPDDIVLVDPDGVRIKGVARDRIGLELLGLGVERHKRR